LYAQSSSQKIRVTNDDNRVSISAKEADLKNILVEIADKTDISVSFPASLKKKITIRINEIKLREAFERLLYGLNYAIIYSGASKGQAEISDVYIYTGTKPSKRARGNQLRNLNQIKAYQRRIESYRKLLSRVDESSRRGKIYLKRIENYEKQIERLEKQLD
jgi:type II secretory pathway component GspD/PulD (secretin)